MSDYHSSFNSKASGVKSLAQKDALDIEMEKHSMSSAISPDAKSLQ